MVNRVGGLASGMDVDSLVEKLMTTERAPLDKLEQQKQIQEWQRDAYREVNTKISTLDTYISDNYLLKSINTKTATSSNSSLVGVTATSSATGTLSIEGVSKLAKAARAVGTQVNATGSMKMSEFLGTGTSRSIELKAIQRDGSMPSEATKIDITEDMTVDQFISKINSSGANVTAVFENGRFSLTAKNAGNNKAGNEIDIVSGKDVFTKMGFAFTGNQLNQTTDGENAIFQVNGIATERSTNDFVISGYQISLKQTFNSADTIAEKYTAAKIEQTNAQATATTKESNFRTAITNYYGSDDVATYRAQQGTQYTAAHNSAYQSALGNTLNLTEQQSYAKFGKEFWNGLTNDEITFLQGKDVQGAKTALAALTEEQKQNYKNLTSLNDDRLATLIANESNITKFKNQADYETYGQHLAKLDSTAITAIKNASLDTSKELNDIHTDIDAISDLSDEAKNILKSFDKETLTTALGVLANPDLTKMNDFRGKATADTLKSVGVDKIASLTEADVTAIGALDLSSADPLNGITDEALKTKLEGYSVDQLKALNNLTSSQLTNFATLKGHNTKLDAFTQAKNEDSAAQNRLTNARNTFNAAEADAQAAGLLNAAGTDVDPTAVSNATINTQPPVTMTSATNTDDVISKIRELVATYNGFIKDLKGQTTQTKYRDYSPLTAAQRKDMSEDEIKQWEEKSKSGLLRNDSIIQSGLNSLRGLVYQTNYGVTNTKYNTLFNIGITTTTTYNDGGQLQIDETKLRKALEEDPDAVQQLLTAVGDKEESVVVGGKTTTADTRGFLVKVRETLKQTQINVEKKAGRTTMTAQQYSLGRSLTDLDKRIDSWKDRMETIEARYWKQFSAMETAINKANSTFSSLFGGDS